MFALVGRTDAMTYRLRAGAVECGYLGPWVAGAPLLAKRGAHWLEPSVEDVERC